MSTTQPKYESILRPLCTLTIGGVKIDMPVKPYPSQVAMMDKVCIRFLSLFSNKITFYFIIPFLFFRLFVAVKKDKTAC